MTAPFTRRGFLCLGLGAATAALVGCAPGGRSAGNDLLVSWYGGQPLHTAMDKALAAYPAASGAPAVRTSRAPFADYWDKLATEVAGGQGPDVFRMSMTYFADYATRGALADLGPAIGKTITTTGLDPDVATSGVIDQQTYGIGQSSITHATFLNQPLARRVGAAIPARWDWPAFEDFATGFAGEAGKGRYGSSDASANLAIFEVFSRQHGGELFADGRLAAGMDVIEEWFAMWARLRASGAVPPANVTAESTGFENSLLAKGLAPIEFGWVQQISFYQPLVEDRLTIQAVPGKTAGSMAGQFVKALDFWCVNQRSRDPEGAQRLIEYLLNDRTAITDIGVNLGVPPSQQARDLVAKQSDRAAKAAMSFVAGALEQAGPPPAAWPKGYGEAGSLFARVAENIGFGRSDPAKGAEEFATGADQALGG